DRMQIAVNAMTDVIKQRSKRFSNARSIVAMAPASGGTRENCSPQQAPRIDDLVVSLRTDIAETCPYFRYRGRSAQRPSLAAPCSAAAGRAVSLMRWRIEAEARTQPPPEPPRVT